MKKIDFKNISNSKNLRLFILEHTLVIEEMVSRAIGSVLDIEWEKSKSFGFSSSSLAFNQKVTIVQDFNDISSEEIKKFGYLMNIRNKFAHIRSVENWQEFIEIAGNGNEIKNAFEKWYRDKLKPSFTDNELIMSFYFKCLCHDLIEKLDYIILKAALDRLNKHTENHINLVANIELVYALKKTTEGKEIIENLEKKLRRKL